MPRTLVPAPSWFRAFAAARVDPGRLAGCVYLSATVEPLKAGGFAAATKATDRAAAPSAKRRDRWPSAVTPAPSNMAMPRMRSGVARSVERSARPAEVSVMKAFRPWPNQVGSVNG